MLLREDRGRHQHRHLAALLPRLEGGAHRHLGLAVADVAADQAVHRLDVLHVLLHLDDRLELVGRLLVGERRLQLALPHGVGLEGVSLEGLPRGVGADQLVRHLLDRLLGARLGLLPRAGAEPVDRGPRALARGVARDQRELLHRDEQAVGLGVAELDAVGLLAVQGQPLHPAVDADPVVLVHHVVADLERGQLGDRETARLLEPAPAPAVAREDLVVGQDGEAGGAQREARGDQPHPQGRAPVAEHLPQAVALAGVVAQDHRLDPVGAELGEVRLEPLGRALHGLGRHALHGQRGGVAGADAGLDDRRHPVGAGPVGGQRVERRAGEEQMLRRRDQRVVRARLVPAAPRELVQLLGPLAQLPGVVQHHQRVGGQVVQQRAEVGVVVRGEAFHAVMEQPARSCAVLVAGARQRVLVAGLTQPVDHRLRVAGLDHHLVARQHPRRGQLFERALGAGVEAPHRDQRVAVELQAQRVRHAHRVDVEDAAAPREVSDRLDLRQPLVAEEHQALHEHGRVVVLPDVQVEQRAAQAFGARYALEQPAHRGQHHPLRLPGGEPGQRLESLRGDAGMGRRRVVGQRVGLGVGERGAGPAEVLEVVARLLEPVPVRDQIEHRARHAALQPGGEVAARRAGEPAQGHPRRGGGIRAPRHDAGGLGRRRRDRGRPGQRREQLCQLGNAVGVARQRLGQLVTQVDVAASRPFRGRSRSCARARFGECSPAAHGARPALDDLAHASSKRQKAAADFPGAVATDSDCPARGEGSTKLLNPVGGTQAGRAWVTLPNLLRAKC